MALGGRGRRLEDAQPNISDLEEGYVVDCSAAIEGEHAGDPDHGLTEQLSINVLEGPVYSFSKRGM